MLSQRLVLVELRVLSLPRFLAPKIGFGTTGAILLRWGKGGRLDPHAGELTFTGDSNRGRGEDDYPAELSGDHNTANAGRRRDYGHAQPGDTCPTTLTIHLLSYTGKARMPDCWYT
jgi:hypothetical protein